MLQFVTADSGCVFRKKRGFRRSAISWLNDRLYVTAADPPRARIRTTMPRLLLLSQIPSPCSLRPAIPTQPRTIIPSHLPSPTPPTSTQQTARWAATTVTTARSRCCINRWNTGGFGWGRRTRGTQNSTRHCEFHLFGQRAQRSSDTVLKHGVEAEMSTRECFILGESHTGNTHPLSFDLTVFNPETRRTRWLDVATSTSKTSSTRRLFQRSSEQ